MKPRAMLKLLTSILKWIGLGVLGLSTGAIGVLAILWIQQPDVSELATQSPVRTRYMELAAREKGLAQDAYSLHWTQLEDISPYVGCAVVKGEDDLFFRHRGFDWREIRLALKPRGDAPLVGASTITQQLARNIYLTSERSWLRKLREALLAHALERALPKRRLLEIYLNVIEFGDGVWGVGDASTHYFGKTPAQLDAFDASFLTALLPSPRRSLAGPNGTRAVWWQLRTLAYLRLSGLISRTEEEVDGNRAANVFAALQSGAPVEQTLAGTAPPHLFSALAGLTWERALASDCGLDTEIIQVRKEKQEQNRN